MATTKKIMIFLLLVLAGATCVSAQISRQRVGFVPYTDPEFASAEHRQLAYKNLYEMALRIFINTQRFVVLDRGSFNIVKLEKEFQKGEDLINSEIIDQGKVLAAQVLVIAKISTFTVTEADDGEGYSVFMTAELKQVDVETGRAVRATQLKGEIVDGKSSTILPGFGTKKKRISTAEEAISLAVSQLEKHLDDWIKDQFPMMMAIMEVNGADMSLIVDGGKRTGLTKTYKLRAVKMKMLEGKKFIETLATLYFSAEGVGEETTKLMIKNKDEWIKLQAAWAEGRVNVIVVDDNR